MIYNSKILEEQSITLPITRSALRTAQQFADEQLTEAKKRQVYLNTLAIWVVNDYLMMMDVPTELAASDSWNSAMRLYADVADLKLIQLGFLECRPLLSDTLCYIPLEVPNDRIGIVVVKVDLEQQEGILLGFTKTVYTGELPLSQLQPFDELLKYIDRKQNEVNLGRWLQNTFEAGWQSLEGLFAQKTPMLAFRNQSAVMRGKLINFKAQSLERSLVLIVTLQAKSPVEVQIGIQIHTTEESSYLPKNLIIKIIDEQGAQWLWKL